MVFRNLSREWLTTWCDGLAHLTRCSYANYCKKLENMFELLGYSNVEVEQLKPYHIQRVINALNMEYSHSTVTKYKAILHCILKCAVRWEVSDKNIVEACSLPRREPKEEVKKFWTADEANTFLYWLLHDGKGYATEQEAIFIVLAMVTGARRGELVALTESDIGYNYIDINKTCYRAGNGIQATKKPKSKYGNRVVSVSPKIIEKLNDVCFRRSMCYGCISPYVFTQNGKPKQMCVDAPSHFFNRIVKQAPVPFITLHGLRHTHASLLIADGMDIAAVSKRLGHSKTSVTLDIYTHSSQAEDNSAAAAINRILGL